MCCFIKTGDKFDSIQPNWVHYSEGSLQIRTTIREEICNRSIGDRLYVEGLLKGEALGRGTPNTPIIYMGESVKAHM